MRKRTADALVEKLRSEMDRHLRIEEMLINEHGSTDNPVLLRVAAHHRDRADELEWAINTNRRHLRETEETYCGNSN